MSYVTVYNCDGPTCLESHDDDESPLFEAGWLTIEFENEGEANYSHFCSAGCIAQWAEELVTVETG